jgi:taspase, threonine aspartase, 1
VVKNPIGLARLILEESARPLSLQRVPPNLLVGQGATDFAHEKGLLTVFNDYMVSKGARERWNKWKKDLDQVEEQDQKNRAQPLIRKSSLYADQKLTNHAPIGSPSEISPPISPTPVQKGSTLSQIAASTWPLVASTADIEDTNFEARTRIHGKYHRGYPASGARRNGDMERNPNIDGNRPVAPEIATDDKLPWASKRRRLSGSNDGSFDGSHSLLEKVASHGSPRLPTLLADKAKSGLQFHNRPEDRIIDTVGAIAVDCFGYIAAGSSSGGIGMKHRGRCGPAALVGIGSAVIPTDQEDPDETSVATVTSGTGEHMATTLAAATCADRIYSSVRKTRGSELESCTEDQAMFSVIDREFMDHPGVKNSHCAGAIGIMAVKKTRHGVMLYFGHNTDSFALASMQTGDRKPTCVMSRNKGYGSIAQGGRVAKYRGNGLRP